MAGANVRRDGMGNAPVLRKTRENLRRSMYRYFMDDPRAFLAPDGRLAARIAGWESRPQQLAMADLVAQAMAEKRHAIVEAGTGTGKSLAYLIPAVLAATADQQESAAKPAGEQPQPDTDPEAAAPENPSSQARQRRVVIATHTIALQEQLITKDIPVVAAVMPREFSAVLVKGRGNYVSLRRLALAVSGWPACFSTTKRWLNLKG